MAKTYNVADARAHLSELLDRAAAGEDIVIARSGKPIVRLVAAFAQRRPGTAKHWDVPDDTFLEPLPEEEQRALEGGDTDEWGISRPSKRL